MASMLSRPLTTMTAQYKNSTTASHTPLTPPPMSRQSGRNEVKI